MSFSPTDAAFEGFRLVRRNPMVLLAWTLLYLVVGVATLLTMTSMFPALAELSAAAEAFRGTDPESFDDFMPILSAYGRMFSGMGWVMVLSILTNVMLTTAVSRRAIGASSADGAGVSSNAVSSSSRRTRGSRPVPDGADSPAARSTSSTPRRRRQSK